MLYVVLIIIDALIFALGALFGALIISIWFRKAHRKITHKITMLEKDLNSLKDLIVKSEKGN